MMRKAIPTLALISLTMLPQSKASDDATIIVRGRRYESSKVRKTGHSVSIRPVDASRFDSSTHLKRESSLLSPDNGRASASGFVVPQIRGQDAKLTDVYLEDILLHDPYSGLPMIEELDLRAFGSLDVHQGLTPADLAGVNPIGSLRYRLQREAPTGFSLGLQAGEPYGHSEWVLAHYRARADAHRSVVRVYARQHRSTGRYAYYSDEGTPYNRADDTIRQRRNNHQHGVQLLPMFQHSLGPYTLQGLAWAYQRQQGLASPSPFMSSRATLASQGQTSSLRISRRGLLARASDEASWGINLGVGSTRDRRLLTDPSQQFILTAQHSALVVNSQRADAKVDLTIYDLSLAAAYDSSTTGIKSSLGERLAVELERRAYTSNLALSFSPAGRATLEVKATQKTHVATRAPTPSAYTSLSAPSAEERGPQQTSSGAGASFALHPFAQWSVYVQAARARRLPSLMEEFGDGSALRGNAHLLAETTRHREFGFNWQAPHRAASFGMTTYADETDDKIVLVPIMAGAMKALNVHNTVVRGWDSRAHVTVGATTVTTGLTYLWPFNTTRAQALQLPGVPKRVFVTEVEQGVGAWSLRWMARYRSGVFRDLANSVELPGAWLHDCSLDLKLRLPTLGALQIGLNIRNAFNVMAVPISAPDSAENRGMTAFSDMAGAPLPGRHWILSLALNV